MECLLAIHLLMAIALFRWVDLYVLVLEAEEDEEGNAEVDMADFWAGNINVKRELATF